MFRVTADTNIFISGLNFKSKPFDLLVLAREGRIELAMSDAIRRGTNVPPHWRIQPKNLDWMCDLSVSPGP